MADDDKKPFEKAASFATAADALREEGSIGCIDREAFHERLEDPVVKARLESARRMWKDAYGRDPAARSGSVD
jgi:hypothetical protein